MSAHLPYPYPDELLSSVLARHVSYFAPDSERSYFLSVAGTVSPSVAFGTRLRRTARTMESTWKLSAEEIVERHTLLPFYGAFFEPDEYLSRVERMCTDEKVRSGNGAGPKTLAHESGAKELRFCLQCSSEDMEAYGETFWRRRHQLSGVAVCTTHGCVLHNFSMAYGTSSPSQLLDATNALASLEHVPCATFDQKAQNKALAVAMRCVEILEGKTNRWSKSDSRPFYFQTARDCGFELGSFKTDTDYLASRFAEHFDSEFLRKISRSGIGHSASGGFGRGGAKNPLTNVLIQLFLEAHVGEHGFTGFPCDAAPTFGWKCPNKKARHPDNFRIHNVVRRKSKLGYDYLHAKCNCGFEFCFDKATEADPLMPEVRFVSNYSLNHRGVAQELFSQYLSVRGVATRMGVSHRTAGKMISGTISKHAVSQDKVEQLRREWFQSHSRAVYQALLKHDRKWLFSLPEKERRVRYRVPMPVEKDAALADNLREAIAAMTHEGERLTLDNLSRRIGFRIVRSYLEDYPLSFEAVMTGIPLKLNEVARWEKAKGTKGH